MLDPVHENIFKRAYSQTSGLFILLVITIFGAGLYLHVEKVVSEMHDVFIENLDPHRGYDVEL
jgi:hypothetical protein